MKVDILVVAAHPDDAELGCAGTILKHISLGLRVGIVDLTRGELGTRGTPELRDQEAQQAAAILGVSFRKNLGLRDGFFANREEDQLAVVRAIRQYQPDIVLTNAEQDRHPDHGKGADLVSSACFLAGLEKISTYENGIAQQPWRPKSIYHFVQSQFFKADIVVDISGLWGKKLEAIMAFKSQFHNPKSEEPETFISKPGFLKLVEAHAIEFGHAIGATHGEGFTVRHQLGVKNLFDLS